MRLEEIGPGFSAVWSKDGTSIYYSSSKHRYDPWHDVPRRYDLETGRSDFLTDSSWHVWPPGLAVSRADALSTLSPSKALSVWIRRLVWWAWFPRSGLTLSI